MQFNDIRWWVQYVIALGFCVLSRKISICTRIAILKKRLKIVHSTYWKCFYHRIRCQAKSKKSQYLILCICIINIIIRYACFVSLLSIIQRKRSTVTLTGASIRAVLRLTRWAPSLIQKSRRNTILNCLIGYLILDTNGTLKLTVIHLKTSNE